MQDRTFSIGIVTFPYGGNGGVANEYPGVGDYKTQITLKAKADPRIKGIHEAAFCDTPITMTRNQAVLWARQVGVDFLLMIDSDMHPDCEMREDPEAKPFWDTSLDFCIKNYDQGPNVVCAPYCGPPPIENVYVFEWVLGSNDCPNDKGRIEQITRERATTLRGIHPCAAQPTGLILFDMRAFELTDPAPYYNELRKQGRTREEALAIIRPWFYYEWEDIYQSKKASTEDVTATRDISFMGWLQHGRDTIYCNWDAWAGHVKPKVVRKPRPLDSKSMHAQYRFAVEQKQTQDKKLRFVGAGQKLEPCPKFEEQPIRHVLEERFIVLPPNDGLSRIGMATPKCDLDELSRIVQEVKPKLAVEIGSWVGESALAICKSLPEDGRLICVDHFQGSPHDGSGRMAARNGSQAVKEAFLKNTEVYRESGQLELWDMSDAKAKSQFCLDSLPPIDFLYLDADHEYEFVKRQIVDWSKFMSPEGVIAGHDYNNLFPGVMRAASEMFDAHVWGDKHDVWYAKVKDLKVQNGKVHEPVAGTTC